MPKRRFDAIRRDFESHGLRAALDEDAQALKSFFKQPFGVRLGQHQRVIIGARHRLHFDVADHLAVIRDDIDAVDLEACLDERRGSRIAAVK